MSYLGEDIRKLGFGLMRLPKIGDEFDLDQIKAMVDAFLDAGFTYFDTAYAYPGSEEAIKKALTERYPREKYQLATKLSSWAANSKEEAEAEIYESMRRAGVDYFDFYLLHSLGGDNTERCNKWDLWGYAKELKEKGLIRHYGFSFHGTPEGLEELLTLHPDVEFVQLQINYADWDSPTVASRINYEICRKHGKPVIIMEPVKGGNLANPVEAVAKVFREAEPDASPASWALRFAADLPGLVTVLSGMSTIEQMNDNLKTMKDFNGLSDNQRETLAKAVEVLKSIPTIPCTRCDYCAGVCPMNIGISKIFAIRNNLTLYGNEEVAKRNFQYDIVKEGKGTPTDCLKCGACEAVCPQHIEIPALLEECGTVLM